MWQWRNFPHPGERFPARRRLRSPSWQLAAEGGAVEAEELGRCGAVAAGVGEHLTDEGRFGRLEEVLVEPAFTRTLPSDPGRHPVADGLLETRFGSGGRATGWRPRPYLGA